MYYLGWNIQGKTVLVFSPEALMLVDMEGSKIIAKKSYYNLSCVGVAACSHSVAAGKKKLFSFFLIFFFLLFFFVFYFCYFFFYFYLFYFFLCIN